ncbi:hypothetical protein E2C01_055200 [Portunus trituberculatus]|uniref:Uncharacterized protein n=1 Tax=Portunus trituberculatus TaxID=210409 RepID=A0A5B7GU70_PORTR|nr:hypothetical protein [Portunus trituberculatus]
MVLARCQKLRGESGYQVEEQTWHDSVQKYKAHEIREIKAQVATFFRQPLYHV